MPAYNEAEAICQAVSNFSSIPEIDEVIVVDNNSSDDTNTLAKLAGANVIRETKQGYGHASKTALMNAVGDLVFIVEPDGTFRAKDIYKFLSYAGEFDAVFGTRTSKTCIWSGANMGLFLRYGNVAVGKLLEYLHNGPCLTDVGCTFKMIRRSVIHQISAYLTVGGSHFSPELMIVLIRTGFSCVEIPIHYKSRSGASKITGDFWKAFKLGLRMTFMIIKYRFRRFPKFSSIATEPELADIGERTT
jgi:glycosyltransferase involved in cell wall biosynthesis